MPIVNNGSARIFYETNGSGFPILTFAPKGLFSTIDVWDLPNAPIKPNREWTNQFQIITVDQRNAGGKSTAPLSATTDWEDFARDHLAILDDLNIEKCHLYGQCIGGPFILKLLELAPERFTSAALPQPIGRERGKALPPRTEVFNRWAEFNAHTEGASEEVFNAIYTNLYGPGFAYSVSNDTIKNINIPTLILAGNDAAHPFKVAEELASMLPLNEGFIEDWKEGQALINARKTILQFFRAHTPY